MHKRFSYTLKYPLSSKIIIFDESRFEFLRDYVLQNKAYFLYKMRPEVIILNPLIIFFLLIKIKSYNWSRLRKNFFGCLLDYYRFVIFSIIAPKVVITFNDNSQGFGRLSKSLEGVTFIAIQNGKRNSILFNNNNKLNHDNYFCFGENDINFFNKHGHEANHYHPIGSFRAGISMEIFDELSKINKYDICIVSIWRPWINNNHPDYKTSFKDIWDTFNSINFMTKNFLESNSLKICVAMRSEQKYYKDEEKYWNDIFGDNVTLIPNDMINLSSFKAVQESTLVIGAASTLILESYGMGKKVLYCDFTGTNKYVDFDSEIVLREKNYNIFSERIKEIIEEPYGEYVLKNNKYAKHVMNIDFNNLPHQQIRKFVENSL